MYPKTLCLSFLICNLERAPPFTYLSQEERNVRCAAVNPKEWHWRVVIMHLDILVSTSDGLERL